MSGPAAARWADALRAWAIPQPILDAAPESPWGLPVALFARRADEAPLQTPSRSRALEALPGGGTVIDVGCGAGAASRGLVPPAGRVVGIDDDQAMLDAFAEGAPASHMEILGRWPDVADAVEIGDVVVCHHVLYNVAETGVFIEELTAHARRRVVVELFEGHPLEWMNPLWRELHGIKRPTTPRAQDALDVIRETGADAAMTIWDSPSGPAPDLEDVYFALVRRRLCLPAERDDELRRALARTPPPRLRQVATIWWDA